MIKVLAVIGLLIAAFIVAVFLITLVWAWVVPDVFAGAVEQHILPATLTWVQALKLWILLLVLGLLNIRTESS